MTNFAKDSVHQGTFDAVFIDADKELYLDYYELSLTLLRTGGLILMDNTLWRGRVADPAITDVRTENMRNVNNFLKEDERI